MSDRDEVMRASSLFWCPQWCTQEPDEHEHQNHVGEWVEYVVPEHNDTVRIRPQQNWADDQHWWLEIEMTSADPRFGVYLDEDALTAVRDLLEAAQYLVEHAYTYDLVKPAYDGADEDAERFDNGYEDDD